MRRTVQTASAAYFSAKNLVGKKGKENTYQNIQNLTN